jgi:hypothetical protein
LETDIMAHIPVNHPMRPLYRALTGLCGLYLVLFGIVGLVVTPGHGLFGRPDGRVLGQGANLFWSIVAIIIGAIVLLAAVLGRNLDVQVGKYIGWGLLVVATYELAVSRTDANVLKFTISTVIVCYILGLVLITSSLYSKVGPPEETSAPRQAREGRAA